jgi:uncharacterized membrane protein
MHLRNKMVGAFIDAVYAIAVTILALEIPSELPGEEFGLDYFSDMLVEYAFAFLLLFALWLQHRRINGIVETISRFSLLINALILLLVCLVPRATKLVFEYGEDVTLGALEGTLFQGTGWTTAELVDLFYVVLVMLIDLGILALLYVSGRQAETEELNRLRISKWTVTGLLLVVTLTSFLLPVENRYFLLILPVVLFFEQELSILVVRLARRR